MKSGAVELIEAESRMVSKAGKDKEESWLLWLPHIIPVLKRLK
jgi:hypothetical protein